MRRIDVFISSSADVQLERSVAERLICSVAAEFGVPVSVSYSNWLRRPKREKEITAQRGNDQQENMLLCPYFWEYQNLKAEPESREYIPDTGRYDLVICLLWSRLGSKVAPTVFMPDGSHPGSATDYEVAWALDHRKRTPGLPELYIYRNRATRAAPLEPKEKREIFCRQWDSVQEFFAIWRKNCGTEFVECCHDYEHLEEFEILFRAHFRNFLAKQSDREAVPGSALRKARYWGSNPFRGLNFFDLEHAPIYQGRTKAVEEVLNSLKNQSMARKPFVLLLGPGGSGKSSLIRAGVLPLLTQGGTPLGNGPWRRALTRPGVRGAHGDPFDLLAAALLAGSALPELRDAVLPERRWSLASELREDASSAAIRITEMLDQLSLQELDHLLDEQESQTPSTTGREGAQIERENRIRRLRPKMQLALVVDPLEELFTNGFSPKCQRKYIAALDALVRCDRIFAIAALRSDCYAQYQQFPELVELTAFGGKYELQPPTPDQIRSMIRFPAEAAGLHFERHADTGQSLEEALLEAAVATTEPLPSLEHLLSQLYQRQLERKDDLLRWSDYLEFGELQGALANHAETVFLTLKSDEQQALKLVMPHLVSFGRDEEGALVRRTIPYRDLVSSPELDDRLKAGAKNLVERLIKEGLLRAETDPQQESLVSLAQEALLRKWPGVGKWLSKDRDFFYLRDRLDASLARWLSRGHQSDDLLGRGIALAEAESLLSHFGSSLSGTQVDYIQRSLAKQKGRRRMRDGIRLAVASGLAVLITLLGVERSTEIQRKKGKQSASQVRQNPDLAVNENSMSEAQPKRAPEKEKTQLALPNTDLVAIRSSAPGTQSRKESADAQPAEAVNQPRSGDIQPLNPVQNPMPAESTQPLDPSVQSVEH